MGLANPFDMKRGVAGNGERGLCEVSLSRISRGLKRGAGLCGTAGSSVRVRGDSWAIC